MSFRLEFRPEVLEDLAEAAAWYDQQEPGFGVEFASVVEKRLEALLQDPVSPRIRYRARGIRWVYPRPFPYRIIYRVIGGTVLVIAIIHRARRDRHWRTRV